LAVCSAKRWTDALSAGADRAALDDQIPAQAGRDCSILIPNPSSRSEKHTTIKPLWDLWRSVTQDFFGTANFGVVANETYARGLRHFLEEEMGLPCAFALPAVRAKSRTMKRCARPSKETPPFILFGSFNERMYLAETGGAGALHSRQLPRRGDPPAHRNALHGLCGRDLSGSGNLQRAV
jgi:hypothetical protein